MGSGVEASEMIISETDLAEGERHKTLGPSYFASRRVAESVMKEFEAEHFKPLIKKLTDEASDALWSMVENHLASDVESNIQGRMYRQVDQIVQGILTGEKWIMDRYVLGSRYDCKKARAAIARHIPTDLQDARIADLEAEVEKLRKDLAFLRRQ